jgi:hypothetical protein
MELCRKERGKLLRVTRRGTSAQRKIKERGKKKIEEEEVFAYFSPYDTMGDGPEETVETMARASIATREFPISCV